MSLLEGFSENTRIFNRNEGKIDQVAFDALVEKHGIDVARGYLKALEEFSDIVGGLFFTTDSPLLHLETTTYTYGKLTNLHKALFKFSHDNNLKIDERMQPIVHKPRIQSF